MASFLGIKPLTFTSSLHSGTIIIYFAILKSYAWLRLYKQLETTLKDKFSITYKDKTYSTSFSHSSSDKDFVLFSGELPSIISIASLTVAARPSCK